MDTLVTTNLKRFVALAIAGVLLMSLLWLGVGIAYNAALLPVVAPLLPGSAVVELQGHDILFTVANVQQALGSSELVLHKVAMSFHSMAMSYGLIVAAAVLIALPGCWQPAKVGHFETREIRDRERAW